MPQLQHILPYLGDDAVLDKLTSSHLTRLAEVCLSASYFFKLAWKEHVLGVAESLLPSGHEARARLELRKMQLSRISGRVTSDDQVPKIKELRSSFQPHDTRSNAYSGDMVLFHARLLIDTGKHREARSVLDVFQSRVPLHTSELERLTLNDIGFVRGEIARYEGYFVEADHHFFGLLGRTPTPPKITIQHSAVCCELGNFDYAITSLNDELKAAGGRKATGLRLALAEAYLMQGAELAARERTDIAAQKIPVMVLDLAGKARGILESLWQLFDDVELLGKVGKINRFKILAAFAMIEHLTGNAEGAIRRWDKAQEASRECWPQGYTDAIIAYSKADLHYRLGEQALAEDLERMAFSLYRAAGTGHHFTGFATVWRRYTGASMEVRHRRQVLT